MKPPLLSPRPPASARMLGLVVRDPYASRLLSGEKRWEIRGRPTSLRGTIVIIKSGTKKAFGTVELTDVLGPLTLEQLINAKELPRPERQALRRAGLPYAKTYAYVVLTPRRFRTPVSYDHPNGAVTWVRLAGLELGSMEYAMAGEAAGLF